MRITKSHLGVPARVQIKGEDEPREGVTLVAREDGTYSLRTGKRGRPKAVPAREIESVEAL